jgi:hypothetical protein
MKLSGICLDGDRGSAVRFDHRDRCCRLDLVAGVADCDAVSVAGESLGNGAADAAGATGDAVSTRAICLLDAWLDRLAAAPSR